jgi:hypothetical protein
VFVVRVSGASRISREASALLDVARVAARRAAVPPGREVFRVITFPHLSPQPVTLVPLFIEDNNPAEAGTQTAGGGDVFDEAPNVLLGPSGQADRVKGRDRHDTSARRVAKALIASAPLTNTVDAEADRRLAAEIDTLLSEAFEPWTKRNVT